MAIILSKQHSRSLLVVLLVLTIGVWIIFNLQLTNNEYAQYYDAKVSLRIKSIAVDHGYMCFLDEGKDVFCPPIKVKVSAIVSDSLFKENNNDTLWIYDKNDSFKLFQVIVEPKNKTD
jgi:hypothetical protein